jgi:hypothetical protein
VSIKTTPSGAVNGLGGPHDYTVYRGKKPLEVELPYECAGGCGRRMEKISNVPGGRCAVCRGAWERDAERNRCRECGYHRGNASHKVLCG